MAEITVAGLADAEALNDDNMFLVSQPEAYNPFTQSPGDTRKVTLSKLTQYFDQDFDQNYVSRKPMTGAQVLKSHLALDKGKELLGTKADGAQANLAALKTYNEGLPDQIEQVEIGSETEHLNLNTNETGEYGNRISVDTKDPATHQPKKEILAYESFVTSPADQVDGTGRDLLKVLGAAGIQAAMDALQARCNGTGTPDFSGLMVGDYLDGLNLSAIPAENGGVAGQAWNDSYKNNRIVLSGFNTYKGCGDTEVTKNHILFTFRNCPITKRINPTDDNTGGYAASELRAFLEGANGDGTGDYAGEGTVTTAAFLNALADQLGTGHLLTIRKAHSNKSDSAWGSYTVFLPSELEVFGYPTYGDEGLYMPALSSPTVAARAEWNTNVHFPIYAKSGVYRIKHYNGSRMWWWEQTPSARTAVTFCFVGIPGGTVPNGVASSVGGCAPAFCAC